MFGSGDVIIVLLCHHKTTNYSITLPDFVIALFITHVGTQLQCPLEALQKQNFFSL